MPKITEITGGDGGIGIATQLARITRRLGDQQLVTELAQIVDVASGRVVSTAHGFGGQQIATGLSVF